MDSDFGKAEDVLLMRRWEKRPSNWPQANTPTTEP
jgi:hypothetical protein